VLLVEAGKKGGFRGTNVGGADKRVEPVVGGVDWEVGMVDTVRETPREDGIREGELWSDVRRI